MGSTWLQTAEKGDLGVYRGGVGGGWWECRGGGCRGLVGVRGLYRTG